MLDWSNFRKNFEAFARLGFAVVPALPGAKHPGVGYKWHNHPDGRVPDESDVRGWVRFLEQRARGEGLSGTVGAYLLPNSGKDFRIVVVDVDDVEFTEQAIGIFGASPLQVWKTSTPERKHHYFAYPRRESPIHALGVFGSGTVDVIGSTGVILPGSVHPRGAVYVSNFDVEKLTFEDFPPVPFATKLARSRIRELKAAHKTARTPVISSKTPRAIDPRRTPGTLVRHFESPRETAAGNLHRGVMDLAFLVQLPDGRQLPVGELEPNTKVLSPFRDDETPGCYVAEFNGRRTFWDWPIQSFWTIEDMAHEDPILESRPGESYHAATARNLVELHGVEVHLLEDRGFIADQLPPLADGEIRFVRAPHGSGKTVVAKSEHATAKTSITVANTKALTIANAAALELAAVYTDGAQLEPKVSTTANQLLRFKQPPGFFHVDEADQVIEFVTTSRKVKKSAEVFDRIFDFATQSPKTLFASADLDFEVLDMMIGALRARDPSRKITVYLRAPAHRTPIRLVPFHVAKGEVHAAAARGRRIFVGSTARKLPAAIAWGYAAADDSIATVSLDDSMNGGEVVTLEDPIDNPRAAAFDEVRQAQEDAEEFVPVDNVDGAFFVSGENNRYHATVEALRNPNSIFDACQVVAASPAIVSGVSFTSPRDDVFALHDNFGVTANQVLQLVMRSRSRETITIGVKAQWSKQDVDLPKKKLDEDLEAKAKATAKLIGIAYPEHDFDDLDPHFAKAWRIAARSRARSMNDAHREIIRAARRHGFVVENLLPDDPETWKETTHENMHDFRAVVGAARRVRKDANARSVSTAKPIDLFEAERLSNVESLKRGERQSIEHHEIRDFYGVEDVPPWLVKLDNDGKFRHRVKLFTFVSLLDADRLDVVAFAERKASEDHTIAELRHDGLKAALLLDLYTSVFKTFGHPKTFAVRRDTVERSVLEWHRRNGARSAAVFDTAGPRDRPVAWFAQRLRSMGLDVDLKKTEIEVDFTRIDDLACAYGERLLTAQAKDECKNRKESSINKIA